MVEHGSEDRLPAPAFLARLLPVLATFMPLLANYIKNEESEMSCLRALEVGGQKGERGDGGEVWMRVDQGPELCLVFRCRKPYSFEVDTDVSIQATVQ